MQDDTEELNRQRRSAVLAVLKGAETEATLCARLGIASDTYRAWESECLAGKLPQRLRARFPQQRPAGGGRGGARVVRDRYGVPHIFADDARALYFAVGYVQAQDRLWQMDHRRRLALGTLAEVLGESALRTDLEHRTIGFGRAADLELNALSSDAGEALAAYADGVNEWIETASADLPVEFDILGYEPSPWTARDSLAILRYFWWTLTGRLEQIVGAERVLRSARPDVAARLLSPEVVEYIVSGGGEADGPEHGGGDDGTGSNNWVVGPAKTTTGAAALASDPHWPLHFPDMWYEQHLNGPGIDCIGAAYPGAPPVIFGRTPGAAWGRTNNVTSTRDLYHERVSRDDPERYWNGRGWVPFRVLRESAPVKGRPPVELTIRLTERGPVFNEFIPRVDPAGDGPITLRWVGHEALGDLDVLMGLNRAQSADDIRAVLGRWRLSVWNAVYADTRGDFGYQMAGSIPVREAVTRGTRPAAEPAHEWRGYIGTPSLPGMRNPGRGWAASANNTPAPPERMGRMYGTYADGYRWRRIAEFLNAADQHSPAEIRGLQADNLDFRARDLKDAIAARLAKRNEPRLREAAGLLRRWNARYDLDQTGAAVFAALWPRFVRRVGESVLDAHAAELMWQNASGIARALLLGESVPVYAGDVDAQLAAAAAAAMDYLYGALGPATSRWAWGRAHSVRLEHPLATTPALARVFNRGPFPCPGGVGALNSRRPTECPDGFRNAGGVSYRFFVDFSEPGRAWAATLAGQSGQPGSPHYADRVAETVENRYHPLLMTPADIEREKESEFLLAVPR